MQALKPLSSLNDLFVEGASSSDPLVLSINIMDKDYSFRDLKHLLAAADIAKAGEVISGASAKNEIEREAARSLLSSLSLQQLYDNPLLTREGKVDAVMQVNYQIDREYFAQISRLSLGELKNTLLRSKGKEIRRIGRALTGVMVAGLTKLLDVHELILLAKRLKHGAEAKARTYVGLPGTLSSRLQPNHPSDNLSGVTLLTYAGLSLGAGDALIGINPAIDTVENISTLLHQLNKIRQETGVPTQICVLSHIKTQLACLENGAPVEILFQSLAGTESTLTDEFDVTVSLLDEAYNCMREKGPLKKEAAANMLYFETGQGSELSYDKHEDIDMTTCEALCYGLARRYSPFMVNNVTGFIGPETHVNNFEMTYSCLQDHFMGKIMGLPMGMAPCFTLHSEITAEGQQMATELLSAAGANFFMDVYLGNDRMLAYFDTSAHDDQTLREVHELEPAPEYLAWAMTRGIFERDEDGTLVRGPNWGRPEQFCQSQVDYQRLLESLPAAYGFDNAGPRPADNVTRILRANQAVARDAIYTELKPELFEILKPVRWLHTQANTKHEHLSDPQLGAHLSAQSLAQIKAENTDVQVLISDGLSAEAVHHNVPSLMPVLMDGLNSQGLRIGDTVIAPYGRVKLCESLGEALQCKLIIQLIGERPGGDASASRSLSAYFAYKIDPTQRQAAVSFSGNEAIQWEYTVISNIYDGGLAPLEAGSVIAEKALDILRLGAAGNRLEAMLG